MLGVVELDGGEDVSVFEVCVLGVGAGAGLGAGAGAGVDSGCGVAGGVAGVAGAGGAGVVDVSAGGCSPVLGVVELVCWVGGVDVPGCQVCDESEPGGVSPVSWAIERYVLGTLAEPAADAADV